MPDSAIDKIISRVAENGSLSPDNKEELLQMLAAMKAEISGLAKTDSQNAQSIVSFAEISAHEATKDGKNPELLNCAVSGLRFSVKGFEASHPELVKVVNSIAMMLSNIGI
jgi:hypothetical protein